MAITTIDGALAGMQPPREIVKALTGTLVAGRPMSLFYLAGIPAAAAVPTPGLAGAVLTSYGGQLPFTNPASGNSYLARFQAQATQAGTLLLCDRLWHNSGINVTSVAEQVFTGASQIPPRDQNGTNAGVGVYAAVEVVTTTGSGSPTLTLKYTDQDGNPGAITTNQVATSGASIAGTFHTFGLDVGDTGIQKVESLTLSSTWTSGALSVVLYRVLARLELQSLLPNAIDALTGGFVRLYDNSVPFLVFVPSTTTSSNILGHVIWTQG